MVPTDFDAFVTRLQGERDELGRFWKRQKDEFVQAVDGLYEQIESFLAAYTAKGSIKVDYDDLELNEEDTGVYHTRRCIITIGHRSVVLTPVGTQLIGMKGRVDVGGGFGRSRLALVDSRLTTFRLNVSVDVNGRPDKPVSVEPGIGEGQISWAWRIVSQPPSMSLLELNQENFLSMLMDISNA